MADVTAVKCQQKSRLDCALAVTPNASQTRSKAPGAVGPAGVRDEAQFPLFASHGSGAYLYDMTGRPYLDCAGANAAVPLGYAHAGVCRAVRDAVDSGNLLSLPSIRETVVSQRFLETCAPWADQVRWVKTGTEAVSAAVRIARAATSRALVLIASSAYHGWSDWFVASYTGLKPADEGFARCGERTSPRMWDKGCWSPDDVWPTGVPTSYGFGVATYEYGSVESLEKAAKAAGESTFPGGRQERHVAAVVIEPSRWQATDPRWLQEVRVWCDENRVLLVFDEMVYGLRWACGGAAQYYGVQPDLACFGKALGNGVPVACVCGRSPAMRQAVELISSTYGGDTIGLAAAEAVLREYRRADVIDTLWTRGRQTWAAFVQECPPATDGPRLEGTPVHWRLRMPLLEQLDAVLLRAVDEGILVHRSANNASAAMTADEAWRAGEVLGRLARKAVA